MRLTKEKSKEEIGEPFVDVEFAGPCGATGENLPDPFGRNDLRCRLAFDLSHFMDGGKSSSQNLQQLTVAPIDYRTQLSQ